jgi:hypothetical protein
MKALNRRQERKLPTLSILRDKKLFQAKQIIDYSDYEQQQIFLEGTGSMVLDRRNKTLYAARSQRTNELLLHKFADELGYSCIIFDTAIETEKGSQQIYHTNVMLAITEGFIVIADEVIIKNQRRAVLKKLQSSKKTIISISIEQMKNFCGNVLQLKGISGNKVIAMSLTAWDCFNKNQQEILKNDNQIVAADIHIIEQASGGSVRCMLAEIF